MFTATAALANNILSIRVRSFSQIMSTYKKFTSRIRWADLRRELSLYKSSTPTSPKGEALFAVRQQRVMIVLQQ